MWPDVSTHIIQFYGEFFNRCGRKKSKKRRGKKLKAFFVISRRFTYIYKGRGKVASGMAEKGKIKKKKIAKKPLPPPPLHAVKI